MEKFREWVVCEDWNPVLGVGGSNWKAEAYPSMVDGAIERFFPLITVRRKTINLPWMNAKARRLIRR